MKEDTTSTGTTKKQAWYKAVGNYTKHLAKTLWALVYIINGVAVGLYAFGFVHPPHVVAAAFGAISIAFSAVSLAILVNGGVKYESGNKRRK